LIHPTIVAIDNLPESAADILRSHHSFLFTDEDYEDEDED
jgi:hypothetical protein